MASLSEPPTKVVRSVPPAVPDASLEAAAAAVINDSALAILNEDLLRKVIEAVPAEHHPRTRATCRHFRDLVPWNKTKALISWLSRFMRFRRATKRSIFVRIMCELAQEYVSNFWIEPEAMALLRKEGPAQLKMKIAACDDEAEKAKMLAKIDEVSKHGDLEDIGTEDEKLLGEVIARTHGQDFYIIDKFPAYVRPFYTMPDPTNPEMANAYDSTPPERGSNP